MHEIFCFLNDKDAVLSLNIPIDEGEKEDPKLSKESKVSMTQNELYYSKKWEEIYNNFGKIAFDGGYLTLPEIGEGLVIPG